LTHAKHLCIRKKDEGGSVILTNGKEIEVARRKKDIFLGKDEEIL